MLQAIDDFSSTHDFLISIGAHKANILSALTEKEKPKTVVELGGYFGYSAILFADTMRRSHPSVQDLRVWSLKKNAEFASIAEKLIDIAGLSGIVTVVVGSAEESLKTLKNEGKLVKADMVFLDHAEELYVADFKACEELGILREGSVVVADNVVRPGAPKYRALVRGHPALKSEGIRGLIQPGDLEVCLSLLILLLLTCEANIWKDELEISYVLSSDAVGDEIS
jgi:catechol O-methyltransferase